MIAGMDDLTGDERATLRTKLNADFSKVCDRIIFLPSGEVTLRIGAARPASKMRGVTLHQPSPDSEELTTVEQVMKALREGHSLGISITIFAHRINAHDPDADAPTPDRATGLHPKPQ
jgi:hypothetical protein